LQRQAELERRHERSQRLGIASWSACYCEQLEARPPFVAVSAFQIVWTDLTKMRLQAKEISAA
jgi:hypothetical protein